jgi:hypothetical protein
LITGVSQLFQKNAVALRVHREEAQATGKRFVLGHGEVFTGHGLGQACGFIVAIGHQRLFNVDIDLLLSTLGGGHKAVEARQMEKETPQANATGPNFAVDEMAGNHEAM